MEYIIHYWTNNANQAFNSNKAFKSIEEVTGFQQGEVINEDQLMALVLGQEVSVMVQHIPEEKKRKKRNSEEAVKIVKSICHIDSEKMYEHGFRFFRSTNGVWLVDTVPTVYILNAEKIGESNDTC